MTVQGSDSWAAAPAIGFGVSSLPTSIASLTSEPGENADYPKTAWWRLPAGSAGRVTLDVNQSTGVPSGDPAWWWLNLRVFRGPSLAYLTKVEAADFAVGSITVTLDGEQDYYVQVTTGSSGDLNAVLTTSALTTYSPTETPLTGAVTTVTPSADTDWPPVIEGSPTPWGDGSDATDTHLQLQRIPDVVAASTQAWHAIPTIPTDAVALGWSFRAMAPTTNYPGKKAILSLAFQNSAGITSVVGSSLIPSDGVIRNYDGVLEPDDFSGSGTSLAAVIANVQGGRINASVLFSGSNDLTATEKYSIYVYELALTFYAEGAPPASAIFGIPPLRQVQRGDGLGFSSAPRAIQNNSVQGSLRNFGFN